MTPPEPQSTDSAFDGVQRVPVDRQAALMFAKGVQARPVRITCDHWETCPPLKAPALTEFQLTGENLTGYRKGRLSVVGMYRDRKGRWVVRCDCGDYELRTAKALQNPHNTNDKCRICRRLDQAKRHHEFTSTGRNS